MKNTQIPMSRANGSTHWTRSAPHALGCCPRLLPSSFAMVIPLSRDLDEMPDVPRISSHRSGATGRTPGRPVAPGPERPRMLGSMANPDGQAAATTSDDLGERFEREALPLLN